MKKTFITLSLALSLFANEQISVSKEERQISNPANMFPSVELFGSNLEKQRDKYLANRAFKLGFTNRGSFIGWGESSIESTPKSIDFAQKRVMAFEKAFADAKAKYARAREQKISQSVAREFLNSDISQEEAQTKEGVLSSIAKKTMALTEATLDKALLELGVNPKDIEKSDINKKRILARDSLSKEIKTRAIQDVSGVRIINTFEDLNNVGVLIVASREYRAIAKAIASKKLVGYPSKKNPKDEILAQIERKISRDSDYIPQYGVRVMTDEYGNRVLISFGQWAPKVAHSDSKMKINMAFKSAREIAYNQSLSYLTMFVNSTLVLENKTKLKDSNEIARLSKDFGVEDIESADVGASLSKFIKENSSVNLEGVVSVKTWSANHPETGHPIFGTVLMWSPQTKKYAKAKPKNEPSSGSSYKPHKIENRVKQGADFGNEDF